jgi:hypothetical protein
VEPITAVVFVVGIIAMALGIGLVLTRRGRPRAQRSGEDYRALFVMGITYLPVGAIMTIAFVVAEGPWVIRTMEHARARDYARIQSGPLKADMARALGGGSS